MNPGIFFKAITNDFLCNKVICNFFQVNFLRLCFEVVHFMVFDAVFAPVAQLDRAAVS
jgi:hypothetical protein